jgi:hypothetical protein
MNDARHCARSAVIAKFYVQPVHVVRSANQEMFAVLPLCLHRWHYTLYYTKLHAGVNYKSSNALPLLWRKILHVLIAHLNTKG